MVLRSDFDGFQRDFSAIFKGIFRVEKRENGSEPMRQIAQKPMIYKKKTKNEGAALDPPYSGGSHKGEIPLDPHRPPETDVLDEENFVFGKNCCFMISAR